MEDEQTKNKYFIGVLGALIGAFIGAIPWILMYVFASMMYAVLSLLIVICSFYGYKLTKAKMDKKLPIILSITSLYIYNGNYVFNNTNMYDVKGRYCSFNRKHSSFISI